MSHGDLNIRWYT